MTAVSHLYILYASPTTLGSRNLSLLAEDEYLSHYWEEEDEEEKSLCLT